MTYTHINWKHGENNYLYTQTHNPLHMYVNKHTETYEPFESIKRTIVQRQVFQAVLAQRYNIYP